MRLSESIYLVGSGMTHGFGLSDSHDCHVYAIVSEGKIALIDAGCGRGLDQIRTNLIADGLDPNRVSHLFLTHRHADHSGGARGWYDTTHVKIVASSATARALTTGDEDSTGLRLARAAGVYPSDFHLKACPVDREASEGDIVSLGTLHLLTVETPGHCHGHLSWYGEIDGRNCLFAGDSVFFGGQILLQNLPDCILADYCATVLRLAELPVDSLLPGHMMFALHGGAQHIASAADLVRRLRIPANAL